MVAKKLGVKGLAELGGATICVAQGTTHEFNMASYFRSRNLSIKPVVFESQDLMYEAFFAGRCDAMTQDSSALASALATRGKQADYMILPELISKEPLGPVVRRGDDEWFAIAKWVVFGLIEAEEYGITQANVDKLVKESQDPVVMRILGTSEDTGKLMGLDKDWMVRAIKAVGNYGEMFERNVGPKTPLNLPRGVNAQWNKGGIMYAPPVR
jgi:general L-amino acid transport system substrate-binding protein